MLWNIHKNKLVRILTYVITATNSRLLIALSKLIRHKKRRSSSCYRETAKKSVNSSVLRNNKNVTALPQLYAGDSFRKW